MTFSPPDAAPAAPRSPAMAHSGGDGLPPAAHRPLTADSAPPAGGDEPADPQGGEAPDGAAPTPPRDAGRGPWRGEQPPRRPPGIDDIFRPRPGAGRGGGDRAGPGGGPARGPDPRPGGVLSGLGPLPGWLGRVTPPGGRGWAPLAVAGVLALWVLATGTHQLGSTEQGVVTTFGAYSRTIGPGATFTAPWPIQDVDVSDVTMIRRDSIPDGDTEKLMMTSDQNLVDLSYIVRWNIRNLKQYDFQMDDPHAAIRDVAEAAMRATVGEVPLNAVMGGFGRAEIEQSVRQRMQAILDAYRAGVTIQGVDIKKADPPDKVVAAFQQVTVAQQGAQKDMSNAQAYAQTVIANARGDAAQFDLVYTQYKAAPDVTRRRMYYETMEKVLANNDKVIVEGNTTSYLPLPQLRGPAPVAAPAPTGGQ